MSTLVQERRRYVRGWLRTLPDALYGMLRLIARHVHGFFGAIAAFLSIGLAVGIAAVVIFAVFADIVAQGATQAFDESVIRWVGAHRSDWLDAVMLEVTALGNLFVVLTMLGVASVFLWLTHHRYSVFLLAVAVVGGDLINGVLKELYDRARPSIVQWATEVHSPSFPSGHAMTAFIAFSTVAYLVSRLEPTPALRRTTWALAILLITAIGASRIYLGVHYPSDIVGGFVAGFAWTVFVAAGMTAIRFFAVRKPAVERAEHDLHAEEEREVGLRQ